MYIEKLTESKENSDTNNIYFNNLNNIFKKYIKKLLKYNKMYIFG